VHRLGGWWRKTERGSRDGGFGNDWAVWVFGAGFFLLLSFLSHVGATGDPTKFAAGASPGRPAHAPYGYRYGYFDPDVDAAETLTGGAAEKTYSRSLGDVSGSCEFHWLARFQMVANAAIALNGDGYG
jgi:hypothetical protein